MKKNKTHALVSRLTIAALALPGIIQDAKAGRVEETYNGDFQYGHYSESNQRMSVDIYDGVLSAPIGRAMTASVNLVRDVISGASPRFYQQTVKGEVKQILSGATIRDQRDAISSNLTYFLDEASLSFGGGFSRENDYTSRYVNTNVSVDLNKKLTTLNMGASVAFDIIDPTPNTSGSIRNDDCGVQCNKTSQQYLLGFSQVLDRDSLLQSNITFGYHKGYLSDPYKLVYFDEDGLLFDTRPKDRFQWAWLTQYVRHFKQFNSAALHADYRFYTDDWGINAHTVELSWHQPVMDGWQLIPRFRYYAQDKADFYQAVFETASQVSAYSSDYRLAGFGTVSGGIKLSKEFTQLKPLNQLKFQAGFEYFDRKASYQLGGNGGGDFDNFSYYLVTASFNLKF